MATVTDLDRLLRLMNVKLVARWIKIAVDVPFAISNESDILPMIFDSLWRNSLSRGSAFIQVLRKQGLKFIDVLRRRRPQI